MIETRKSETSGWRVRLARIDPGLLILAALFLLTLPLLTPRVAASDEIEYFAYLHSILLDHDLDFRNEYEHFCNLDLQNCIQSRFKETFLDLRTVTGLPVNYGPIGSAVLWAPFYLAAHALALAAATVRPDTVADGYGPPYVYAVSFASLLYGWLGIALAYLTALQYVKWQLALGAALVTLFATNAVYYMYVAPAMSHAPSLFASALFVYLWARTRESRARGSLRAWAALGASGALMTLVREQEALFVVIPLVEAAWNVLIPERRESTEKKKEIFTAENTESTEKGEGHDTAKNAEGAKKKEYDTQNTLLRSVRNDGSSLKRGWAMVRGLAVMAATWLIVFLPQFVVYRVLNGNFLPARDVTGKFTWDGVHVLDVLFSDLHGLFSWTPVTLLAVMGLFLLWRRDRVAGAAFLFAFAAEVYLLGSFSTWFGGASYGMRRFINCTPLFVLGLAVAADVAARRVPRPALAAGGALLIVWNLLLIVQFATGIIPRAEPVDLRTLVYNQVFVVPARLEDIVWRFITARGSFYKH